MGREASQNDPLPTPELSLQERAREGARERAREGARERAREGARERARFAGKGKGHVKYSVNS